MTVGSITTVLNIFFISGLSLMGITILVMLYSLVKKRWYSLLRAFKYLVNCFVAFGWSFTFYFKMAIIVRPPSEILPTKEASVEAFHQWVTANQLRDGLTSIVTLVILSAFDLVIFYLFGKRKFRRDLIVLPVLTTLILAIGIWIAGKHTEASLIGEVFVHDFSELK